MVSEKVRIPEAGVDKKALLERMNGMRGGDADWLGGRAWCLVYYAGEEHYEFIKEAHHLYFSENGLNPMAFESLKQMEKEVVQMTAQMLHGGPEAVGTMTSGGTESILMAVKAARERFRSKRLVGAGTPEIVAPRTVHVAFEKAAHYFGMKIRYAPVDDDFRVNIKALKRLVGRNTALIAASAPQYAHGVIDPIEEIGAYAKKRDIPFHVDGCFGGFFLPWMEKLGYELPRFDFRVPGVTSMSADVHKYGYGAKGASVVVYRSMDYLKHQFFVATDWPGGIYASPSMPGTRPGGPIAAAWAAMMALGEEGYLALTKQTMEAVKSLRAGVEAIGGVKVLGAMHGPVVAVASEDEGEVDLYAVVDQLFEKGWHVDRQQDPKCFHMTVTANHGAVVPEFLRDLEEAVEIVRANPELKSTGEAAMYGMIAKIPFRGAVKYSVQKIMEGMYGPDGKVPDLGDMGGEEEDFLFQLIDRYGDRAMELIERIEASKKALAKRIPWGS